MFCIEIGHDGFTPFSNSKHSVWGVWVRCRNVAPDFLGSKYNMYPCMLIPPSADMHACMSLLARDLRKYMPPTADHNTVSTIRVYDSHRRQQLEVHVVLTGIFADGPARDKLTLSMGHNALLGCYWCCLPGFKQ